MRFLIFILLTSNLCLAADDPRIIDIYSNDGAGTAFSVIAPSGKVYLVTNAHVCEKNKSLITKENEIAQINPVIKVYDKADLCILGTDMLEGFTLAKTYYKGQSILVIGYPGMQRSESAGNVLGVDFIDQFHNYFLVLNTDCKPGSSGSPVLDSQGNVLGIVALVPQNPKEKGAFAVPLGYIKDALRDL